MSPAIPVLPLGNSEYLTAKISLYSGFTDNLKTAFVDFLGGTVDGNPSAKAGDMGLIPGQEDPMC